MFICKAENIEEMQNKIINMPLINICAGLTAVFIINYVIPFQQQVLNYDRPFALNMARM